MQVEPRARIALGPDYAERSCSTSASLEAMLSVTGRCPRRPSQRAAARRGGDRRRSWARPRGPSLARGSGGVRSRSWGRRGRGTTPTRRPTGPGSRPARTSPSRAARRSVIPPPPQPPPPPPSPPLPPRHPPVEPLYVPPNRASSIRRRIFRSTLGERCSTYQTSSSIRSAQGRVVRPLICAQPVSPGLTSRRRRWRSV